MVKSGQQTNRRVQLWDSDNWDDNSQHFDELKLLRSSQLEIAILLGSKTRFMYKIFSVLCSLELADWLLNTSPLRPPSPPPRFLAFRLTLGSGIRVIKYHSLYPTHILSLVKRPSDILWLHGFGDWSNESEPLIRRERAGLNLIRLYSPFKKYCCVSGCLETIHAVGHRVWVLDPIAF